MLLLPAHLLSQTGVDITTADCLCDKIEEMKQDILSSSSDRNNRFFDDEMEKLDNWADDMKLALRKRVEKRQNLYAAQDKIDEKKELLLSRIEKMLQQKTQQIELFTIKWRII